MAKEGKLKIKKKVIKEVHKEVVAPPGE